MRDEGGEWSWRTFFRVLAEKYCWGPEQVMRLTDYQIRMYLMDMEKVGSKTVAASRKEAEALRAAAQQKRASLESLFIERVLNGG